MRTLAFHLPQFHPIPENDEWWGKGFTEWTNTAKAQPLFRGHYQPHLPTDLGYYDLRLAEAREAQAAFALRCGLEGFVYWHYWFTDRRILERPVERRDHALVKPYTARKCRSHRHANETTLWGLYMRPSSLTGGDTPDSNAWLSHDHRGTWKEEKDFIS